jgi:hypothetical protein
MTTDRLQLLEVLVDELMKEDPSESVVTKCMTAVGLKDSKDPIDRINQVLKALHFEEPEREIKE